jgi:hypothetical protein
LPSWSRAFYNGPVNWDFSTLNSGWISLAQIGNPLFGLKSGNGCKSKYCYCLGTFRPVALLKTVLIQYLSWCGEDEYSWDGFHQNILWEEFNELRTFTFNQFWIMEDLESEVLKDGQQQSSPLDTNHAHGWISLSDIGMMFMATKEETDNIQGILI